MTINGMAYTMRSGRWTRYRWIRFDHRRDHRRSGGRPPRDRGRRRHLSDGLARLGPDDRYRRWPVRPSDAPVVRVRVAAAAPTASGAPGPHPPVQRGAAVPALGRRDRGGMAAVRGGVGCPRHAAGCRAATLMALQQRIYGRSLHRPPTPSSASCCSPCTLSHALLQRTIVWRTRRYRVHDDGSFEVQGHEAGAAGGVHDRAERSGALRAESCPGGVSRRVACAGGRQGPPQLPVLRTRPPPTATMPLLAASWHNARQYRQSRQPALRGGASSGGPSADREGRAHGAAGRQLRPRAAGEPVVAGVGARAGSTCSRTALWRGIGRRATSLPWAGPARLDVAGVGQAMRSSRRRRSLDYLPNAEVLVELSGLRDARRGRCGEKRRCEPPACRSRRAADERAPASDPGYRSPPGPRRRRPRDQHRGRPAGDCRRLG